MIQLIHGNCLDKMKDIPDNSIDLVITSPPYDDLRLYNKSLEWNFEIFEKISKEITRVLKEGGIIVWIVGDATIKGSETGTSFKQALYFKDECNLNLHDTMIWNKGAFTAVGALKTRYAPVFEYMFIFSKGDKITFNPIKDRKNKHGGRKKHGTIRQADGSTKPMSNLGVSIQEYGQRFNIWEVFPEKSNNNRLHPAMFPINLIKDHILSWSNENDIILDPFMGSGTTGLACKITNRNFIGIEKVEEYFEIAKQRIGV